MTPRVDHSFMLAAGLALALVSTSVTAAGDPEEGRTKAMQCAACHGIEGRSVNPSFPKLAGQTASYLAIQLHEFRSGERYHPVMSPIAEALSDEDIDDLSAYYSSLPAGEN